MRTHESQEMYLETILLLRRRKANVRSVDIVDELGYAKSSVSRAVNLLQDEGLITIDENGDITMTAEGLKKNRAYAPGEMPARYAIRSVLPLDMLPQTKWVQTLVLLERK